MSSLVIFKTVKKEIETLIWQRHPDDDCVFACLKQHRWDLFLQEGFTFQRFHNLPKLPLTGDQEPKYQIPKTMGDISLSNHHSNCYTTRDISKNIWNIIEENQIFYCIISKRYINRKVFFLLKTNICTANIYLVIRFICTLNSSHILMLFVLFLFYILLNFYSSLIPKM